MALTVTLLVSESNLNTNKKLKWSEINIFTFKNSSWIIKNNKNYQKEKHFEFFNLRMLKILWNPSVLLKIIRDGNQSTFNY